MKPFWPIPAVVIAALAVMVFVAMLTGNPKPAYPQIACGQRKPMTEVLLKNHGERLSGLGLVGTDTVMELFLSPTGSWTILATNVNGISCLVGSGSGWEGITPPPVKPVGTPS